MQSNREKQQKALELEKQRLEQAMKDNNLSKAEIHRKTIENLEKKIGY